MKIYRVVKLDNSELDQIVTLHTTLLTESFLNKLGYNFIKSFYKACSRDEQNLFYLNKDNRMIVGFLVGTLNNQNFIIRTFVRSAGTFITELIGLAFSNPYLLPRLFKSVLEISTEKPQAELQFIAVDKRYQGQGIGTKLINKFNSDLKRNEINSFIVGTQMTNQDSNRFYKKLGYKLIKQRDIFGEKLNFYQSI